MRIWDILIVISRSFSISLWTLWVLTFKIFFYGVLNLNKFFVGLQNVAVEALKHLVPRLSKTTDKGVNDITLKYLEQLTDANVAVRRGSALAIGSLPFEFLATKWKFVLPKLCSACAVEVDLLLVRTLTWLFLNSTQKRLLFYTSWGRLKNESIRVKVEMEGEKQ